MERRKIRTDGNSLVITIPTRYASHIDLHDGDICEIRLSMDSEIVITPDQSKPKGVRK
jgi:antitoxin component of MazEF toxin-antitoxin module